MRTLAILTVLAASTPASADSTSLSSGFVAVGGAASVDSASAMVGYQLEGGLRLGRTPLYARGVLEAGGVATVVLDDGTYVTGRLGLELRHRWLFVGADAGVRRATVVDDERMPSTTTRFTEELFVPRVGIDIGGRHLRGRFAAELPIAHGGGEVVGGFGITAAVGCAF